MKPYSILIIALFLVSCQPKKTSNTTPDIVAEAAIENYLKGTSWQISQLLCFDEKVEHYSIMPIDTSRGPYVYGDFVSFIDSVHFTSHYSAPCGNDCFRTVFGKYRLTTQSEMVCSVDSVTYDGDCARPMERRTGNVITFAIEKRDSVGTIELTLKSSR